MTVSADHATSRPMEVSAGDRVAGTGDTGRLRVQGLSAASDGVLAPSGGFSLHPSGDTAPQPDPIGESLKGVGHLLLNAIGEGVCIATRVGDLLWCNDYVGTLTGAMRERVKVACRQFDREHPAPPPGVQVVAGSEPARITSVMVEEDRHLSVSISPLPASTPTLGLPCHGLIVVITDVSATRRLQFKIAAIDQAGADLMRLDADVVRKYNAMERLQLLEERIVKIAASLLHFDHFAIRLVDEREDRLLLVIGHNLPPEYDAFIIRARLEGHGITGHVAASGRSYICNDIRNDPLYLPGVEGAKSSLTIPLRVNDKVIGVFNVESLELDAFTEEDRQLGEIFARYVAMALNMLDLLVVERITTNQTVTGRVTHELDEPLQDIAHQVELLLHRETADGPVRDHLRKINDDLVSIRSRMKECAIGPQSLLDVERAMADRSLDPVLDGKYVLVADDEPNIRRIIGDYLSLKGCRLKVCSSGLEAINAIKADPGAFDLVISDIRMPDANGYDVFSAARTYCTGVPVILMTGFGYDPSHSIVRAHTEGLHGVLFKPFQLQRLMIEVRGAFGASQPPGA
ncbi:MAG: response regulator [Phycisphaerae bacterium]